LASIGGLGQTCGDPSVVRACESFYCSRAARFQAVGAMNKGGACLVVFLSRPPLSAPQPTWLSRPRLFNATRCGWDELFLATCSSPVRQLVMGRPHARYDCKLGRQHRHVGLRASKRCHGCGSSRTIIPVSFTVSGVGSLPRWAMSTYDFGLLFLRFAEAAQRLLFTTA
jgi:hypothetical protein